MMYFSILFLFAVFGARLFQLQVLQYDQYQNQALANQQKKFTIPAQRGEIYLRDNSGSAPLVLNETKHLVWVDPQYVEDVDNLVAELNPLIKRNARDLTSQIKDSNEQYLEVADEIDSATALKIEELSLGGVGISEYSTRVYPEGELAAHVLGFVNIDGDGQYGIEQHYEDLIGGKDGQFKAVTDTKGVPLRASDDNILIDPEHGSTVNLTLDRGLQSRIEEILTENTLRLGAQSASSVVINPDNGEVLAMANYPSFSPKDYIKVANAGDEEVFNNIVVDTPYEVGSVAKIFTMATGLNNAAVDPSGNWYDPGVLTIDGYDIENVGGGAGTKTIESIITDSINTGVVHVLSELGGGNINNQGKTTLHNSFTNEFGFGSNTGIELANEQAGTIQPVEGAADVTYANMTFGQGMTNTMIQIASGLGGLINGGTQYQPTIIDSITDNEGDNNSTLARVLRENVVSPATSQELRRMLVSVAEQDYLSKQLTRKGFEIGGKTGTAQLPLPDGTYSDTLEIGSFVGYIDNNKGERYVIMTRIDRPQIAGFAGGGAAAPIFGEISQFLIDYYSVSPNEGIN